MGNKEIMAKESRRFVEKFQLKRRDERLPKFENASDKLRAKFKFLSVKHFLVHPVPS